MEVLHNSTIATQTLHI